MKPNLNKKEITYMSGEYESLPTKLDKQKHIQIKRRKPMYKIVEDILKQTEQEQLDKMKALQE